MILIHNIQHVTNVHTNRNLSCIVCPRPFSTPSAIAQHLESGRHGISRHQVTTAIHSLSIIPAISLTRRITTSNQYSVSFRATPHAFNGYAYECHICHRMFRSMGSLSSHFNSPAHDANQFSCPGCKKHFKLISALIQHVESGSCGLASVRQVRHQFQFFKAPFPRLLTL
jgi:hypothetical protein